MFFFFSTAPEVLHMCLWNLTIVAVYHLVIFAICIKLPQASFREHKRRYQIKKFERSGKFYRQTLKIEKWKAHVPQFTGKNGFSKAHMPDRISVEYLNAFIAETCRAEWTHETQSLSVVFVFLFNPPGWGLGFAAVILLINLPCTAIQRYNRFRLQALRKRLLSAGALLPCAASV